jgi:hypothetical protein
LEHAEGLDGYRKDHSPTEVFLQLWWTLEDGHNWMCKGPLHNGRQLPDEAFPMVIAPTERVESRAPETEMIQNQCSKANLHDFNGYALQ